MWNILLIIILACNPSLGALLIAQGWLLWAPLP